MVFRLLRTLAILQSALACSGVSNPGDSNAVGGSAPSGGASAKGGTGGAVGGTAGAPATGSTATSGGGSGVCGGTPSLGTVTPAALTQELSQSTRSFLLINVHTPLAGNIPGTDADIAYTDVAGIEQFIGTDRSRPVVIYCYSDPMALIAGPALIRDGYCSVRYLQGGLNAWQTAGYPVDPT